MEFVHAAKHASAPIPLPTKNATGKIAAPTIYAIGKRSSKDNIFSIFKIENAS